MRLREEVHSGGCSVKIIRSILFILSLTPAFIRHPVKTYLKVERAIKAHKPAWYYFSLSKSYRKSIGEGYKIRLARKHLFRTRTAA